MLRGHLRLFATIDSGQSIFTRLIAGFIQANPGITAELSYTNRPSRMIEEGCDAGVVAGDITDDSEPYPLTSGNTSNRVNTVSGLSNQHVTYSSRVV